MRPHHRVLTANSLHNVVVLRSVVPIAVQDQLFPRGQWSRRLISWVARIIHPTEVR
jgi:hypothetical protein